MADEFAGMPVKRDEMVPPGTVEVHDADGVAARITIPRKQWELMERFRKGETQGDTVLLPPRKDT